MIRDRFLADDFKFAPYWLEDRPQRPDFDPRVSLNAKADVVIIGAGVTGVEAARALAAGGRNVVVLDEGIPGEGATSRNAGQIGRNFKHAYSQLAEQRGSDFAKGVFAELQEAYDAVETLGNANPRETGWRKCGRVIGAMSQELNVKLQREYERRARDLNEQVEFLNPDQFAEEMNSRLYFGGIRLPNNGAVQPAIYHDFLERRAAAAGARIVGNTKVKSVTRKLDGFEVATNRGTITSRNVMVATNGYTGPATPQLQSRLLPMTSYMIATEELPAELIATVLPKIRTYHDNRRRSHFFTGSPDGKRILMGARTGSMSFDMRKMVRELFGDLVHIFPQLRDVRLSHGWRGNCAVPVDVFPSVGEIDGLHYALGYSFSGLAMGPHLARKAAAMILGQEEKAHSHFLRSSFPRFPPVVRGPWTVAAVLGWYAWVDRPAKLGRRM